jgi:hypothetical protein
LLMLSFGRRRVSPFLDGDVTTNKAKAVQCAPA